MTFAARTRRNRAEAVSANIISDGCRDYVVTIEKPPGVELLRNWRGRVRRFASLEEARSAIGRTHASNIRLSIRIAADEACAGASLQDCGFAMVPLAQPDR